MRKYLAVLGFLLVVGCTPPSMNLQRSLLRDTGDSGITVLLDETPLEKVDATRAEVKDIGEAILKFLDTGKVYELTRSELAVELKKIVPEKYDVYYDMVMTAISEQQLDVDKIGQNNVARIRAAVVGALRANELYKKSDRKKEDT